jgi:hypothetical protein
MGDTSIGSIRKSQPQSLDNPYNIQFSLQTPYFRLSRKEITGKCAVKIMMKHAQT